jgi:hypothetical protein
MNLDDLNASKIDDDLDRFSPEEEALAILFERAAQANITLPNSLLESIYQISATATDSERERISFSTHGRSVYDSVSSFVQSSEGQYNIVDSEPGSDQ